MRRFVYVIIMIFCLPAGLNAQDGQSADVQLNDSVDMKKRDSILIKRINPESLFHKKLAEIDSSSFDKKEINKRLKTNYPDYRQWRFGVNGGIEQIISPEPADISEELLKYKKSLKFGLRFGADAVFFVSPNIGLGVNYAMFGADSKTEYISYNKYEGSRQDDVNIYFAGPLISIRSIPRNNKFYASCDFVLGYFVYTNDLKLNNVPYNIRKNNFGFATSIGADFMLMRNMSLGVSFNIMAASVKNMEILNGNNVENLSRISLVMTLKTYR
jgi:opacity protein-like surface antigen